MPKRKEKAAAVYEPAPKAARGAWGGNFLRTTRYHLALWCIMPLLHRTPDPPFWTLSATSTPVGYISKSPPQARRALYILSLLGFRNRTGAPGASIEEGAD